MPEHTVTGRKLNCLNYTLVWTVTTQIIFVCILLRGKVLTDEYSNSRNVLCSPWNNLCAPVCVASEGLFLKSNQKWQRRDFPHLIRVIEALEHQISFSSYFQISILLTRRSVGKKICIFCIIFLWTADISERWVILKKLINQDCNNFEQFYRVYLMTLGNKEWKLFSKCPRQPEYWTGKQIS